MRYRFFVVVRHNVVERGTDGQAEKKDSFVRATPPTKGELHNARPSGRSAARRAQKFQSIPLAAVSQIYLNRHRVTQR